MNLNFFFFTKNGQQCHLRGATISRERMRRVFEEHHETTTELQDEVLATFDNFIDPFSTTASDRI